jgi:prevent-host-death family protein
MSTWQLQTAKAKLSELLRAVREHGPQVISVRGKEQYVVSRKHDTPVQEVELDAGADQPKTLWDLFEPLRGSGAGDALAEALSGVREGHAPFDHEK